MRGLLKCPIPSTCTTAVGSTLGLSHMLTVIRIQRPWLLLKRVSRRWRTHSRPRVQSTRAQSRIWVFNPLLFPLSACCVHHQSLRVRPNLTPRYLGRSCWLKVSSPFSYVLARCVLRTCRTHSHADRGCSDGRNQPS